MVVVEREDSLHHRQIIAMKNKTTGKVVFGVRGTQGARDIFTDAMLGVRRINDLSLGARSLKKGIGLISAVFPVTSSAIIGSAIALSKFSKEFSVKGYMNQSELFIKKVMQEHDIKKEDVIVTGHSLGAIMSQLISARVGVEGHGFNGFSVEKNLLTFDELKHMEKNFKNHSFDKDALSNFASSLVESQIGNAEWYQSFEEQNMLSAHSIISFNKSLIRWVRTNEQLNNSETINDIVSIMKEHGKKDFMEMFIYKIILKKEGKLLSYKKESKEYLKHFDNEKILEFYDKLIEKSDNFEEIKNIIVSINNLKKPIEISKKIEKLKEISQFYVIESSKKPVKKVYLEGSELSNLM